MNNGEIDAYIAKFEELAQKAGYTAGNPECRSEPGTMLWSACRNTQLSPACTGINIPVQYLL
jgi:hypothetical protein